MNGTKRTPVVKAKPTTSKPQTPFHSIKTPDKQQKKIKLEQFSKI